MERKYLPIVNYIEANKPNNSRASDPYVVADGYSHIGFKIWNNVQKFDWALNYTYEPQNLRKLMESSQYKYLVIDEDTKESEALLHLAKKMKHEILVFGKLKLIKKLY
tara:strand:+ start:159 stop:482 length:324 start_codon:yes stop_codon:yes gene_type:complete